MMKLSRLNVIASFCLAVFLCASAEATPSTANTALPGTLNYVEGQATFGDQTLGPKSIGQVTLQAGQSLNTDQGKAEVLLTPGVFLRLDDHSAVKMISAGLTNTQVEVNGRAMVEVAEIHSQNNLRVIEDGVPTQLVKNGLYDFDSQQGAVRVFKGKAVAYDGDREIKIDSGRELDLSSDGKKLKTHKFNAKLVEESDLYRWSSLRSSYLAEANMETNRVYIANGWWGPGGGWYWSPWLGGYTFLPGDGLFYSPFGWGFYSPIAFYRSPFFFGGVGRPLPPVGHPVFGHAASAPAFHGGEFGGFHGGGMVGRR